MDSQEVPEGQAVPEAQAVPEDRPGLILGLWLMLVGLLAYFIDSEPVVSVALLGFALAVLALGHRRERAEEFRRTAVLGAVAVALLVVGVRDDVGRLVEGKVRVWNVYHYYLGAKYFAELGYTDLYLATLAADEEGEGSWKELANKVRDLRTYEIVRREEALAGYDPARSFTPERWRQFKEDVDSLRKHRKTENWRNIFRDRGYNGSPLWTTVGRVLGLAPADSGWLILVCSIDTILLGLTGALLQRTFGARRAVLVLLLFVASPANVARLVGGVLQTDWLCAIVSSVCLYRLRRERLAGALMAYAVMTRVFPVILVAGLCLPAVFGLVKGRRPARRLTRYLVSLAVFCALGLLLGLANGRGAQGWAQFVETIAVHRGQHVLGDRRIGLEHIFTADARHFGESLEADQRAQLLEENRWLYYGAALLLLGLFARAAVRCGALDAQLSSLAVLFALMVLSRYYFGLLALLPLLRIRWEPLSVVCGSQIGAFLGHFAFVAAGYEFHSSYVVLNVLLAVHLVVVLLAVRRASPVGLQLPHQGLEDPEVGRPRLPARQVGGALRRAREP